ncbi:MAG: hypothetical protein R6V17_00790 [Halanaerobacter sp.]
MKKIKVKKEQLKKLALDNKIGVVDMLQFINVKYPKDWKNLLSRGLHNLAIQINDNYISDLFSKLNLAETFKISLDEYSFIIEVNEEIPQKNL